MEITIKKSEVAGNLVAPPSKSYTHRAVICAALSSGKSTISNPLKSDDTDATERICKMFGAKIRRRKNMVVDGRKKLITPPDVLDCHGSGTTLRFFTAISALAPHSSISVLTGNMSLRKRPVGGLLAALRQVGVNCASTRGNDLPPITVHGGGIKGGSAKMRGDISSQFISAMIFACPKASKKTELYITTSVQSRPYIEMSLDVLSKHGIEVMAANDYTHFTIPPQQEFRAAKYAIEGDFTSAAFMLVSGVLAGKLEISNLSLDSKQGDKAILQILKEMNAIAEEKKNSIVVEKSKLVATTMDASFTPDLVPICAVAATQAKGTTRIINAKRLRIKESDRLAAITTELKKMGAHLKELPDGLIIQGPTRLTGAVINAHNDHRIAMACAVAGLVADGKTVIQNMGCIKKSYPSFVKDMKNVGADLK
ncbi:MAG: 3-phosphoshikimate 1-carboxyvinyltransferase [Candidatus Methanofastidiosia archaeon]